MDTTVDGVPGVGERAGSVRGHRARQFLPETLAILGGVAIVWCAIAFTLWQSRLAAVETARGQTATLARAFAESSERIATVVDRQLLGLRAGIAEKGEAFDLAEWERTRSSPDQMTVQIGLIDASGSLRQNSLSPRNQGINLADREHFRVHLDPGRDAPFISRALLGRSSNRWTVQFTRKLLDRDGRFVGVAVVSVGCDDLARFYDNADIAGGFVSLVGLDGAIRGHGPARPGVLGLELGGKADFGRVLVEAAGTMTVPVPWDGTGNIVSFRRLNQFPLVVMVGQDEESVFRHYNALRDRAVGIGGAATLVILLLGRVWIQQRSRSAASRRALLLTLDNMGQGIVLIDADGRVPVVNRRAVALLGLPASLLGPRREARSGEAEELGLLDRAAAGDHGVLDRDGRIIEILNNELPGGGLVRTFTDVTEQRIAEAHIRHMAHHDSLTGLANRVLLNERLGTMTQRPDGDPFGVAWLNLDGFRMVNDTVGHDAGDRLLLEVSRRLSRLGGAGGLVARTGGDEFAVLRAGGGQPEATLAMASAILASLDEPIDIDGSQFRLSASLGLAYFPEDGTTPTVLLQHAVTAMYQGKSSGRGSIVRFDPDMDRALRERGQMERDLRRALREGELEVWFQPRFETDPLRISGFEALARWRHPERGFIPPSLFIPVAEQAGLIAELGMAVLEDACLFAASLPDGRIAVNLSPMQFLSDNLADLIGDVLARNNLTPDRLELEVTEGVLIADEAQALQALKSLHDRHLHLALDDFGTGYASLSYLRRFPFDRIKIDQSFVRAQEHDETTRAIIESVLTMARRLRLEVTAEGVETEQQLNLLLSQGCPEVQGYFLGRPMPAGDARTFHAAQDRSKLDRRHILGLTAA